MVLNYIWIGFIIIAFVIALAKLVFLGDVTVFPALIDSTFASSKTAFEIVTGEHRFLSGNVSADTENVSEALLIILY